MNTSEEQLKEFLQHLDDSGAYRRMELRPQGDNTTIEKAAVNLCIIKAHGKEYCFGGISEPFYDKMVFIYDSVDRGK